MYQHLNTLVKPASCLEPSRRRRNRLSKGVMASVLAVASMGAILPSTAHAMIQGSIFMDWNDNATKDAWEQPLTTPKTTIFLRDNAKANSGQGGFYSTETDASGNYSFSVHDAGSFTIWSGMGQGWWQTTPIRGEGIGFYNFNVANATDTVTVNFGLRDSAPPPNNIPVIAAGDTKVKITLGNSYTFVRNFTDTDATDRHYAEWDFGDNNNVSNLLPTNTYSSSVTHTYTARGKYTVTFKVTDTKGAVVTTKITVTVEAPPIVDVGNDIALDVGELVNFSGTFSDPDGKPRYNYTWDYGDGNTSVGRKSSTRKPIKVKHTFNSPGEYTVNLAITDKNGNKGSDSLIVNVRGINTDPCATGVAKVRSKVAWGMWDNTSTWDTGAVPGKNDWVMIQGGHRIILPREISSLTARVQVKGLCIAQNGVLQSAFNSLGLPPSWLNFNAASVHNMGKIQSAFGVNDGLVGGSYKHATSGSSIKFFVYKFINDGEILAHGRGGDDKPYLYYVHQSGVNGDGGDGGWIEIYPSIMTNNGKIQGGKGGDARGFRDSSHFVIGNMVGGNGGSVRVFATNLRDSTSSGQLIGGCGGDAEGRQFESIIPGSGGSVSVNVGTISGKVAGCKGTSRIHHPHYKQFCTTQRWPFFRRGTRGFFSRLKSLFRRRVCSTRIVGWDPTILKATSTTRFEDVDNLVIFGGEDWTMDLKELSEGAISAEESIMISVGKGGVVDLPIVSGKVFKAEKFGIFADEIRMNGKTLTAAESEKALKDLVEASDIVIAPSKILYNAEFSYKEHVVGEPNIQVPITLTLLNTGPKVDTYTLTVTNSEGWEMDGLPETISVNSQRRSELEMNVTLPATRGEETIITVTAKSQSEPEMEVVAGILVGVIEEELIAPRVEADAKADLTLVIDDSSAMAGEIINVANALEDFLIANFEDKEKLTIELITFKDTVVSRVVTSDVREIIGRIRSLRPSGGDDCPNAAVAALESALPHINSNGQIILATAATPHKDTAPVIAQAQQQNVKINVLLAGSCGDEAADKATYTNLANATNGTFQWMPRGVMTDVELKQIVADVVTDVAEETVTTNGTDNSDTDDGSDDTGDTGTDGTNTGKASGTLRDQLKKPMAGVTVQVGDKTTVTDASGAWEINNLPEGEYVVTVNQDGYYFPPENCIVSDNQNCKPRVTLGTDLSVKVIATPRTIGQDENLTYLITVTNNGSETATGVVLTDVLPKDVELISFATLDNGVCDTSSLICTLADLAPGAMSQTKLVLHNTQTKRLTNTAQVTAKEYPVDVQTTRTTVIPYLSVSITDNPEPVQMEGNLHYDFDVALSSNAPKAATGVELVTKLPNGVELQSVNSDNAMCDTSNLPTITCAMTDLNIASHAKVAMDVVLRDPGLLVLTHEASVTANEYPLFFDRERTKIFIDDNIKVDMIFVVDDTGSMQEEINGVIAAIKQVITDIDTGTLPFMALVTFKDDVKVRAATTDPEILIQAVEKIKVSGGGLCEEASGEALELAIKHLKDEGVILLATDASPYDDIDVDGLVERIRNQSINFNVIMTGDCNGKGSWNNGD